MVIDDREINADGPAHIWINTTIMKSKSTLLLREKVGSGYLAAEGTDGAVCPY